MSKQTMISNIYSAGFTRAVGVKPIVLSAIQGSARLATATFTPLASQPRLMSSLKVEMTAGEATRHLNHMMSEGRYAEAVTFGRKVQAAFADQPGWRLDLAEFAVADALALIRTGVQSKGITQLQAVIAKGEAGQKLDEAAKQGDPQSAEGERRNYVLGRAHNNLGYAYEQQAQYLPALWELGLALPYFQASELWEELANTCDNMGRAWARLGGRDHAESYIQAGLKLRRELKRDERTCLSLISYANFHLSFGEPGPAHQLALEAFRMAGGSAKKRQLGLACITLSRSLQQLAALPRAYSRQKRIELLEQAQKHLMLAKDIFENAVEESVRRIEVYVEMGCTCRDLAALLHCDNMHPRPAGFAAHYIRLAGGYLQDAIRLSKGKYPMLYSESCQALEQVRLQSESVRGEQL